MRVVADAHGMPRGEWLEVRRGGVGGSDASVLMGHSRFSSVEELYLDKMGQGEESGPENEAQEWGHILEPVVAEQFSSRNHMQIYNLQLMLQSEEYPWMYANVDRLTSSQVPEDEMLLARRWPIQNGDLIHIKEGVEILECKTSSAYLLKTWDQEDPPAWAYDQVHHYMVVTGARAAWVACLVGGRLWRQFYVPFDEEYAQDMVEKEREFWETVSTSSPPPIIVQAIQPAELSSQLVTLTPAQAAVVALLRGAVTVSKLANARAKAAKATLLETLLPGQVGLVDGVPAVTVYERKSTTVKTPDLKTLYPEVYKAVSRDNSSVILKLVGEEE